jgi:16S rRNA (adenine1518-N6/adenine1519-N6)-dimethyltransferase
MTEPPDSAHRARRRFGQHFLEPVWAAKLVRAIAPARDQTFLEIGPGRGILTRPLAAAARRVIAFEIDRDLAAALREERIPNLEIVEGDVLDLSADRVRAILAAGGRDASPVHVAGNLPYNVASPILFKLADLFAAGIPIVQATVMLQREVADRLLAAPGTKAYGVPTVLVGHVAQVDRLLHLPPGAFRPAPKVQSTVVRLRFHAPDPPVRSPAVLAALTQAVFTRRRKTLANALLAYGPAATAGRLDVLERLQIDPRRRPETLTLAELVSLADSFAASEGAPVL